MTVFIEMKCPNCHNESMYGVSMRDLRLSENWTGLKKECVACEKVFSFSVRRYMTYEAIDVMKVFK